MLDNNKQLSNAKIDKVSGGDDTSTTKTINCGNLAHNMELKGIDATNNILLDTYHKGYIRYDIYKDIKNDLSNSEYIKAAKKLIDATSGNKTAIEYFEEKFGKSIITNVSK